MSVRNLQKLSGRAVSFMLVVPGAKLFTREMNYAISVVIKSRGKIVMSPELREELEAWKFLDTWQGKMVWKQEKHLFIELFSDSSIFKWGGVIQFDSGRHEIYDFWTEEERKMPIMVLEAKALLNVLRSVKDSIFGRRVDSGVDNLALLNGWKNDGTRSRELNKVLKDIFDFVLEHDIILNLVYVKSAENVADAPPFSLIAPVISFIEEGGFNCTIIVPASDITPVWQPNVADRIKDALLVGAKSEKGVLRYPSKKGFMPDKSAVGS